MNMCNVFVVGGYARFLVSDFGQRKTLTITTHEIASLLARDWQFSRGRSSTTSTTTRATVDSRPFTDITTRRRDTTSVSANPRATHQGARHSSKGNILKHNRPLGIRTARHTGDMQYARSRESFVPGGHPPSVWTPFSTTWRPQSTYGEPSP